MEVCSVDVEIVDAGGFGCKGTSNVARVSRGDSAVACVDLIDLDSVIPFVLDRLIGCIFVLDISDFDQASGAWSRRSPLVA